MPYLKKDGTPRYIPKYYEVKGNKNRKRKYYNNADKAKRTRKFRQRQRNIRILGWSKLIKEGKVLLMQAELEGTLEEAHELIESNTKMIRYSKDYQTSTANLVYDLISDGKSLKEIANTEHEGVQLPRLQTLRRWYREVPAFKRILDQAYTDRADYYADKLYELMEEVKSGIIDVKRATFVADQIKWFAERLHPKFMQRNTGKLNIDVDAKDDGKVQFNIILGGEKNESRDQSEAV